MKTAWMGALAALMASGWAFSVELPPCDETLKIMERVADWQMANPSKHHQLNWTQGAFYTGMMALGDLSVNPKYRDAMLAIGEKYGWTFPNGNNFHADDHTVGQMYSEMYRLYGDPRMLAPQLECFDYVISDPALPHVDPLRHAPYTKLGRLLPMRYWWCDALFMTPPALARLTAVTGDTKYLDFAISEWKVATKGLYNADDDLFFRDDRFFPSKKKEKNGKNIYWSRGNGWVMGGLVRVLQVMPLNHPERPWFEKQFKAMAASIIKIQPEDGAWRASLLDPETYKLPEASGTGFFTYALAWGYNQGLLGEDAKAAALKGWQALCSFVLEDGKLTHVQIIAADPTASVRPDTTEVYGPGAFLCAGSEVYRMAMFARKEHLTFTVKNNTKDFKGRSIVLVGNVDDIKKSLPNFSVESYGVMDGGAARWVTAQVIPQKDGAGLVIQADLMPEGEYAFTLFPKVDRSRVPQSPVSTFARFVPERLDDFAFENDRAAFRVYGPALEKTDGLSKMGAGVDAWGKAVRTPVLNKMYASKKYHSPSLGYGIDAYKVGTGPGCGAAFPWIDGKPVNLGAFKTWEIEANGPLISTMLFTYESKDGSLKGETRYSIPLGTDGFFVSSTFTSSDKNKEIIPSVGLSNYQVTCVTMKPQTVFCEQPGDGVKGMAFGTYAAGLSVPAKMPVLSGDAYYILGKPGKGSASIDGVVGTTWSRGIDYPDLKGWGEQPVPTEMIFENVSVKIKR